MRNIYLVFAIMLLGLSINAQSRDNRCDQIDSLIVSDTMGNLNVLWHINDTVLAYNLRYRLLGDTTWIYRVSMDTTLVIMESDTCVEYEVSISTVCPFDTSSFTLDTVISFCPPDTMMVGSGPDQFTIFPNPFAHELNIQTTSDFIDIQEVNVYNLKGQKFLHGQQLTSSTISTNSWPAGVYIVQVLTDDGIWHLKQVLKL